MTSKLSKIALFLVAILISPNSKAQELKVDKATFIFGYGSVDRFSSTEFVDHTGQSRFFKEGSVITAETHIPTKFSKNIKYVFGGTYYSDQSLDYSSFSDFFQGGGVYTGINAMLPLIPYKFSFGLIIQPSVGYYNFIYDLEGSQKSYSGLGTSLKCGLFLKLRGISLRPQANFQMMGSQKTNKSIIGSGFGVDLGYDF